MLLDLPAEIRKQIYEELFADSEDELCWRVDREVDPRLSRLASDKLSILLNCRRVNREARDIARQNVVFHLIGTEDRQRDEPFDDYTEFTHLFANLEGLDQNARHSIRNITLTGTVHFASVLQ